ncbi:MAG: trypsin-like peptidase domain-containing protein [Pirellulales bacterium]|nr:trypsin-like peptidase domain-containing protein [Pirellulales bacterium]
MTPVVRAVREAAPAVVNIQGQKSVSEGVEGVRGAAIPRQVNGMGTGIVIDPRGYVLTNFHVVDGVRQINVTLHDGSAYIAQIVAHDKETDLAVIRIRPSHSLPTLRIGTSSDLLVAESVIAVGNAFGYENTVTTGIISALHRNVQVNETQQYLDLIQTDASINPGNSGGPLLNVAGEMIGVNVAVRAGAQGIGFAIPVDKALEVATRLMSIERVDNNWHGMTSVSSGGAVSIARLDSKGPAAAGGIQRGDQIKRVGPLPIQRPLDVERALLGRRSGDRVPVVVERDGSELELELVLAPRGRTPQDVAGPSLAAATTSTSGPTTEFDRQTWDAFGMTLESVSGAEMRRRNLPYDGGMRVVSLRPGGPAEKQHVQTGDVLIRVHKWYTTSENDVRYIVARADSLGQQGKVRFDIIRGTERFFGEIALGSTTTRR